jgi:hypothetical protein
MLSFFTDSKCYHFYVIIFPCTYFVLSFMLSFDVNINGNTLKIIPQKWYICDFDKKITPSASWKMITSSTLKMIPNVCKLSIHGNDFIYDWAYAEMSNILAEPNTIFKNLVLQALGTIRIRFLQKKANTKFHDCVFLKDGFRICTCTYSYTVPTVYNPFKHSKSFSRKRWWKHFILAKKTSHIKDYIRSMPIQYKCSARKVEFEAA